jgi:hypothetical protein
VIATVAMWHDDRHLERSANVALTAGVIALLVPSTVSGLVDVAWLTTLRTRSLAEQDRSELAELDEAISTRRADR